MKKWVCKVCGYVHTGDNAPEVCPQCHAKNAFVEQKESKGFACEHQVGSAKGLDAEVVQGLVDNFNGECSEVGMYLAMSRQAEYDRKAEKLGADFLQKLAVLTKNKKSAGITDLYGVEILEKDKKKTSAEVVELLKAKGVEVTPNKVASLLGKAAKAENPVVLVSKDRAKGREVNFWALA